MAKYDRCSICDYSEGNGSSIMGVPPGGNGKVRLYDNDFLCDACFSTSYQNFVDLVKDEEDAS
jgi:hypothetical protein